MKNFVFILILLIFTSINCYGVEPLVLSDVIKETREIELQKKIANGSNSCIEKTDDLSFKKAQDETSKQLNETQKVIK